MRNFCIIFGFFLFTSTNFSYGKRQLKAVTSYEESDGDLFIDDCCADDNEGFSCEDTDDSSYDDESFACESSDDEYDDDDGYACESSSDYDYYDDNEYNDDGFSCSEPDDDDDYVAFSCTEYERSDHDDRDDYRKVPECRWRAETRLEYICLNNCDCDHEECENENEADREATCLEDLTTCYSHCENQYGSSY